MAHSNRQKLKESRGGLTRNQHRKAQKAGRASGQSARLQETIAWIAKQEEKRRMGAGTTVSTTTKAVKFSKNVKANERRKSTLLRLKEQLRTNGRPLAHYKENDEVMYNKAVERINKEIAILQKRVA